MTKPEAVAMINKFVEMLTCIDPSNYWECAAPPDSLYTVDGSVNDRRWSLYVLPPEGDDWDAVDKYNVLVCGPSGSWTF